MMKSKQKRVNVGLDDCAAIVKRMRMTVILNRKQRVNIVAREDKRRRRSKRAR